MCRRVSPSRSLVLAALRALHLDRSDADGRVRAYGGDAMPWARALTVMVGITAEVTEAPMGGLTAMSRGDHVFVRRLAGYTHHGIDAGDGTVIHFAGEPGSKLDARVRRDSISSFARGNRVQVKSYGIEVDCDAIVERAESRVGEAGYDLMANNCEHFACWCVTGRGESGQVKVVATSTGVAGGSTVLAAAGLGVVAAAGPVAGLSGAGMMSGLAATGAVVGGGAVAGLVVLGLAPAALSTMIMSRALADSEVCPRGERTARTAGRLATGAGALTGLVSGGLLVSAVGVPGLSAAGISSGLATIGGVLGGGMAMGTAMVAAMPALLAALLGYLIYRGASTLLRSTGVPAVT